MLFSIWDRLVEISFSQLIKIIKATHAHRLSNSTKAFDDNSARNEKMLYYDWIPQQYLNVAYSINQET